MPAKTQSIFLGALVIGLLGTSYLGLINLACCAGVIIGAMVGIWHYTNENALTISTGQGAVMGALAGVIGAVIAFALNYLLSTIGVGGLEELQQSFFERFYSEEQLEAMREMQESSSSGMFKMIGFFIGIVINSIFGAVGGAIGAAVFKKGGREPETTSDLM